MVSNSQWAYQKDYELRSQQFCIQMLADSKYVIFFLFSPKYNFHDKVFCFALNIMSNHKKLSLLHVKII